MKQDRLTKEEIKLSKNISYILRHNPSHIGITLDNKGRVLFSELVDKYNIKNNTSYGEEYILDIFSRESKKRYEVKDGKIRAYYGHSFPVDKEEELDVPKYLLHGTTIENYESILKTGYLLGMSRDKVHLTTSIDMAKEVALRHGNNILVLEIDTEKALRSGVTFNLEPNDVWLSTKIPISCIRRI